MTKSSFPHDRSYDYDADFANGEIFNGDGGLAKVGRVAPRAPLPVIGSSVTLAPSAQDARAASALVQSSTDIIGFLEAFQLL